VSRDVTKDETGDATRRTLLASERTVLAWLRTGLTVMAVAVGIGKIAPDLGSAANADAWAALGAAYAVFGVAVIAYGLWRGRRVDAAVREGRVIGLDDRVMWALGTAGTLLGVATAVLIVIDL
jgi:putative membrane protein